MQSFEGRVAVVTGGGSGIGEALSWRFANEGAKVVVADVNEAEATRVAQALKDAGHQALAIRTDVTKGDQVEALAKAAVDTFGSIDVLCANAGVVPSGRYRPVWEYPVEDWKWSFDVNMMGVVHSIRSFVPRMLEQGTEGHIVVTASIAGIVSGSASVAYGAAKHAALRITEGLYAGLRERDSKIGVTALIPGLVNTKIYQSERNRPQELQPEGGALEETQELKDVADKMYSGALSPAEAAGIVVDAIRANQLYAITTTAFDEAIKERHTAIQNRENPQFATLLEMTKRDIRSGEMKAQ
ncbi:short-chain dehydrogenase/reductase SDR [Burkholderia sp. H160]|nr:short-chain dehydrogenase/reductase SDR [Burkholderia sp. H160]